MDCDVKLLTPGRGHYCDPGVLDLVSLAHITTAAAAGLLVLSKGKAEVQGADIEHEGDRNVDQAE